MVPLFLLTHAVKIFGLFAAFDVADKDTIRESAGGLVGVIQTVKDQLYSPEKPILSTISNSLSELW